MNTATRVLAQDRVLTHGRVVAEQETLVFPAPKLSFMILALMVLLSAIGIIYIKDYNRRLFADYQGLQKNYTALQAEHGKLLLEQNLVASRPHMQEVAEQELQMHIPAAGEVVMVKQ